MEVIGLTGNIGSGKSTVGRLLATLGAVIIDCDEVSRQLVAPGQPCFREIINLFGQEYLLADGRLDRKKMAANIFADMREKEKLEQLLHPAIIEEVKRQIGGYQSQGVNCVVLEAPLLIEAGLTDLVDAVWLVLSRREDVLARLERYRGYSRYQGEAVLASQMPDEEKISYADVIIENNSSLADLQQKVITLWETHNKK